MTTKPQRGDLVNVEIKGVRMGESPHIRITVEDERGELWVLPPQAAITRIAPAEWPPRVTDLWRGRTTLWFVMQDQVGNALMTDRSGGRHGPEYVAQQDSPLNLVYRDGLPGPGSEVRS